MRDYAQDKIDTVLCRKKNIEELCIYCPNCRCPYLYLDEFDVWMYENGYDASDMWE